MFINILTGSAAVVRRAVNGHGRAVLGAVGTADGTQDLELRRVAMTLNTVSSFHATIPTISYRCTPPNLLGGPPKP
jgi:hypothetical protein